MKLKKLIAGMTAFLLICGAMPVTDFTGINFGYSISASAVEFYVVGDGITSDGFKYDVYGTQEWDPEKVDNVTLTRDYVVITGYEGSESAIEVPAKIENLPVTQIGSYVFNDRLTNVTLPETLKIIGDHAFEHCTSLVSISIPNSVVSIGDWAFYDCSSLTKLKLSNSLTAISDYSFAGCSKLAAVDIPKSVKVIKGGAFVSCSSITKLSIPDTVIVIGDSAFEGCSGLTSVALPSKLTSIAPRCFAQCSGIQKITIPDGVTVIGESAFDGCTSLSHVDFPSSLSVIEGSAFGTCGFKEITIPDSISIISEYAFAKCSNLTKVTIPDSITKISHRAFGGCPILKEVIIPADVEVIETESFGYDYDIVGGYAYDSFTIYGYKDTPAEIYAKENGFTFVDISIPKKVSGDINSDGKANVADAVLLQKYLLAAEKLTKEQYEAADLISDGSVDAFDMIEMRRIIIKK